MKKELFVVKVLNKLSESINFQPIDFDNITHVNKLTEVLRTYNIPDEQIVELKNAIMGINEEEDDSYVYAKKSDEDGEALYVKKSDLDRYQRNPNDKNISFYNKDESGKYTTATNLTPDDLENKRDDAEPTQDADTEEETSTPEPSPNVDFTILTGDEVKKEVEKEIEDKAEKEEAEEESESETKN